ncbi:hypothetical protein Chor_011067 [Crotalus horridus]
MRQDSSLSGAPPQKTMTETNNGSFVGKRKGQQGGEGWDVFVNLFDNQAVLLKITLKSATVGMGTYTEAWLRGVPRGHLAYPGTLQSCLWSIPSNSGMQNPDNDTQPWCFLLQDRRITWEYCNITRCQPQTAGELITKVTGAPPLEEMTMSHADSKPGSPTGSAPVCGQRYTKVISSRSRIVGGVVALPGAHPYLAALYIGEQFCGGSLIGSCWILTAAHCLEFRQIFYNTSTEGTVKSQVQKYQVHANYSQITKEHDIALVQLKEKSPGRCIEFSNSISPICLPGSFEAADSSEHCQIAGWGHMYEGADKLSVYLQEADVPIIPHEQCHSPEVHGSQLTQYMLCAGYLEGRIDSCQGDSGGPLACEKQGKATVRGIVSWSTGCAQKNKPGVYTNVAHYLSWIQSNMH